jgi:hypothetical protein
MSTRDEILPTDACERIRSGHCPDCGHRGFVLGPRGGINLNIECGNLDCRARFNVALTDAYEVTARGPRSIWFAHRIDRQSEGGTDWLLGSPLRKTDSEKLLILILQRMPDANAKAVVLQNFIAEFGPLSEEAGTKVRELLRPLPKPRY